MAQPALIRSAHVLDRGARQRSGVRYERLHEGEVEFGLTLPLDAFQDMGEPDQITVTIEPGSTLSDGGRA